MTSRFLKPDKAKSFNSSQPNPPAPTTNTVANFRRSSLNCNTKKSTIETPKKIKINAINKHDCFERKTSGPGSKVGPTRWPGRRRSLSRSRDLLTCAVESAIAKILLPSLSPLFLKQPLTTSPNPMVA